MSENKVPQTDPRAELVAGLRALADFYENNPTMPVPLFPDLSVSCSPLTGDVRDDEAAADLVHHAAQLLGVKATPSPAGGWNADRLFGSLRLHAYSTTRERMARHHAESSYAGCVQPAGSAS